MAQKALLLVNLGSPSSPAKHHVKEYLREFLMDEKVIDASYIWRSLLVKGIIVPARSSKSAEAYHSVWLPEGSPLILLTQKLQQLLTRQLNMPVEMAMRYGHPSAKNAFNILLQSNADLEEVIVLPLYPHYAMSSYETAVEAVKKQYQQGGYGFQLSVIKPYFDNPLYIKALGESIKPYLNKPFNKLLLSYHGVPERHILKSDVTKQHCLQVENCCSSPSAAHTYCYRHQTITTTKKLIEYLQLPEEKVEQTFQSRLGKDAWLKPYTADRLKQLPSEGVKHLLIACPAFVSDCLETLEEIAIQGKEIFLQAGGETFTTIPCLNVNSVWVHTITEWVQSYIKGEHSLITYL
jgi:ferrochelatase